jgi:hypothetical protein
MLCRNVAMLTMVCAGIMLASSGAYGHVPYLETGDYGWDAPFRVARSIAQSIAVYACLDPSGTGAAEVDVYQFTLSKPTQVYAQALVPVCPLYAEFRPSFAIVGPGLPVPEEGLPFELPAGCGAIIVPNFQPGQPRPTFYEPFGNKTYYDGPEFRQTLSTPGTYYAVYWDPAGLGGDYVAVLGDKEMWGLFDILRALINTPKIRRGAELHTTCR